MEQATLQAQQECAAEEEAALAAINKEMDDKLKALTEAQLGEIKNRYVALSSFLSLPLRFHNFIGFELI